MAARKRYSREFKLDAISRVLEQGYIQAEAARSLDVNTNMPDRWIKAHEAAVGRSAFDDN